MAKNSSFSGVSEKRHNISLIVTDLKASLKKMPPKLRFFVVPISMMETNMFNSPVAIAIWDLFFNIRSNEIEDYFLVEFKVLTSMMNGTELIIARKDVQWLNKVQDAVYRTKDFVDKIRSEALNDRLEATSQTKRSMLHNLPFWSK